MGVTATRAPSLARWTAGLIVFVMVAAACGSTADPSQLAVLQNDPGGGAGLGPPIIGPSSASPAIPGDDPGGGAPGPIGPGGPGAGIPTVPGGGAAPGVTDDAITIGFSHSVNQDQANQALGAEGITGGDQKGMWDALIDDINDRGGLAGRRVEPVFHATDSLSNETFDSQMEAACQTFTEDHTVYAALGGGQSENYVACMERAGAVSAFTGFTTSDAGLFRRYPHYVEVAAMNLDRIALVTVSSLVRRGFFPQGARIGVVTYEDPAFTHALATTVDALSDRGFDDVLTEQVTYPERFSDVSQVGTEASAAAFRFKSENVTHVLFIDYNATVTGLFMNAAQDQDYHPRYGLNSQSGNSALVEIVPGCCADQLVDALAVGWSPVLDLSPADYASFGQNASRRRCIKVMNDHGLTFDSPNAEGNAVLACDMLWFLETVVERAAVDRTITTDTFLTGVHSLGGTFQSGDTFDRLRFGPAQHDGIAFVGDMAFREECTCFRYTGAPYSVP